MRAGLGGEGDLYLPKGQLLSEVQPHRLFFLGWRSLEKVQTEIFCHLFAIAEGADQLDKDVLVIEELPEKA